MLLLTLLCLGTRLLIGRVNLGKGPALVYPSWRVPTLEVDRLLSVFCVLLWALAKLATEFVYSASASVGGCSFALPPYPNWLALRLVSAFNLIFAFQKLLKWFHVFWSSGLSCDCSYWLAKRPVCPMTPIAVSTSSWSVMAWCANRAKS